MDKQFDELSKSLAEEGISRKEALWKIGVSLAGVLMATVGLSAKPARAGTCLPKGSPCFVNGQCCSGVCARGPSPEQKRLLCR